jgi:hypothetical protein
MDNERHGAPRGSFCCAELEAQRQHRLVQGQTQDPSMMTLRRHQAVRWRWRGLQRACQRASSSSVVGPSPIPVLYSRQASKTVLPLTAYKLADQG